MSLRTWMTPCALLAVFATAQAPTPSVYGNAVETMDRLDKQDPPVALFKFAESDNCTINFLAANTPVRPHYHAKHEESVVVLRGQGTFVMGGVRREVKTGDVMHITKNTVHSFEPKSKDVVVVSIFTPKYDGVDRIFVDGSY